jgi:hypothetical protein
VVYDVWRAAAGPSGGGEALLLSAKAVAVLDRLPWLPSPPTFTPSHDHDTDCNCSAADTAAAAAAASAVYRWRLVPLPPPYAVAYAPLQGCAVSGSGLHLAVAGTRGLALLTHPTHAKAGLSSGNTSNGSLSGGGSSGSGSTNRDGLRSGGGRLHRSSGSSSGLGGGGWSGLSGGTGAATGSANNPHKWRLFGTEQQERALRVANLAWWGDDRVVLVADRGWLHGAAADGSEDNSGGAAAGARNGPLHAPAAPSASSPAEASAPSGAPQQRRRFVVEVYPQRPLDASALAATCALPRGLQPTFLHVLSADHDGTSDGDGDGSGGRALLLISDGSRFALFRLEPPLQLAVTRRVPPSSSSAGSSGGVPQGDPGGTCCQVRLVAEGHLPSVQGAAPVNPRHAERGSKGVSVGEPASGGPGAGGRASGIELRSAPTKEMWLVWVGPELRVLALDADGK